MMGFILHTDIQTNKYPENDGYQRTFPIASVKHCTRVATSDASNENKIGMQKICSEFAPFVSRG